MAENRSARLTKTYTDQQRQAVLHAHLVEGLSIAETERLAMAGKLGDGLEPFGRPRFGYSIVSHGRETYEAQNPDALDSGSNAELKRLTRLALAKARELDSTSDVAEIARRAKALAETHRALRGAETKQRATKREKPSDREAEKTGEPTPQSQADVLAQLTGLADQRHTAPTEAYTEDEAGEEARGPVRSLAR